MFLRAIHRGNSVKDSQDTSFERERTGFEAVAAPLERVSLVNQGNDFMIPLYEP